MYTVWIFESVRPIMSINPFLPPPPIPSPSPSLYVHYLDLPLASNKVAGKPKAKYQMVCNFQDTEERRRKRKKMKTAFVMLTKMNQSNSQKKDR